MPTDAQSEGQYQAKTSIKKDLEKKVIFGARNVFFSSFFRIDLIIFLLYYIIYFIICIIFTE